MCVSRTGRLWTGTNCRAIQLSILLLAAPFNALAQLVAYRCTKGSQMIDVALQQRTTLTRTIVPFTHEAEPDHKAIDTSDELKTVDARLGQGRTERQKGRSRRLAVEY